MYSVETDFAPDLPLIVGDEDCLEQIVVNVIINGEQVMEQTRGALHLTIRTFRNDMDAAIDIVDTSSGLTPADLEQIFDLFYHQRGWVRGVSLVLRESIRSSKSMAAQSKWKVPWEVAHVSAYPSLRHHLLSYLRW